MDPYESLIHNNRFATSDQSVVEPHRRIFLGSCFLLLGGCQSSSSLLDTFLMKAEKGKCTKKLQELEDMSNARPGDPMWLAIEKEFLTPFRRILTHGDIHKNEVRWCQLINDMHARICAEDGDPYGFLFDYYSGKFEPTTTGGRPPIVDQGKVIEILRRKGIPPRNVRKSSDHVVANS